MTVNEIMKELAQLGKVSNYVPKGCPNRMISTVTKETIWSTLACIDAGIYTWIYTPEGRIVFNPNQTSAIMEINNIYYFMD